MLVTPQTGIGRTGKVWGYENFDIEPDVIASAKVRAILLRPRLVGDCCVSFTVLVCFLFSFTPFSSSLGAV